MSSVSSRAAGGRHGRKSGKSTAGGRSRGSLRAPNGYDGTFIGLTNIGFEDLPMLHSSQRIEGWRKFASMMRVFVDLKFSDYNFGSIIQGGKYYTDKEEFAF